MRVRALILSLSLVVTGCGEVTLPEPTQANWSRPRRPVLPLQGVVTDEDGRPVANVEVSFEGGAARTDAGGAFLFEFPPDARVSTARHLARVAVPGYQSLTLVLEEGKPGRFTMRRGSDEAWRPPVCAQARRVQWLGEVTAGWWASHYVRFRLPEGRRIAWDGPAEGFRAKLCQGQQCLVHDWAFGDYDIFEPDVRPSLNPDWFEPGSELRERDVIDPLFGSAPTEYRAVMPSGTRVRRIWLSMRETIFYDGVDETTAAVFDEAIDSMCWLRPG